jgi:hypothetical protein
VPDLNDKQAQALQFPLRRSLFRLLQYAGSKPLSLSEIGCLFGNEHGPGPLTDEVLLSRLHYHLGVLVRAELVLHENETYRAVHQ